MAASGGSRSGNSQAVRHPSAVRILERISGEKGGRYATLCGQHSDVVSAF